MALLSSEECKKIVLLVARPEMQVRLNGGAEPEPWLYHTFTVTVSNELQRNRDAKVPGKRRTQVIAELCPCLASKENSMILLGLVFPKPSKLFPADRASSYTNKAGSTNGILVKYEVEPGNYV